MEDDVLKKIKIDKYVRYYMYLKLELKETEYLSSQYEKKFIDELLPEDIDLMDIKKSNSGQPSKPDLNSNSSQCKGGISGCLNKAFKKNAEEDEFSQVKNVADISSLILKKLYRKISILTHPDKCIDEDLQKIFIVANDNYNNNNLMEILLICHRLGIEYMELEVTTDDFNVMRNNIKDMKDKISQIKQTESWKWGNKSSDDVKNIIKKRTRDGIIKTITKRYKFSEKNIHSVMCFICNKNYENQDVLLEMRCNHEFHESCLLVHFRDEYKCPKCSARPSASHFYN